MTDPAYGSYQHEPGQPIPVPPPPTPNRTQVIGLTAASCTTAAGATFVTALNILNHSNQDVTVFVALIGYGFAAGIGWRIFGSGSDGRDDARRQKLRERDKIMDMLRSGSINASEATKLLKQLDLD